MNCARCGDTGLVAVCVDPMAGLAGYDSEPCGCSPVKRFPMPEARVCPRGLCDGSGTLAPHPSTVSADAGLDDPCPCRDLVPVSARTATWVEIDSERAVLRDMIKRRDELDAATWAQTEKVSAMAQEARGKFGPRDGTS